MQGSTVLMAKYGLCAVAAAALLCTAVAAATMAAPTSAADRWNDLSVKFRKYHSDDTNVFFHLITTPLGVLSVLSLFNKATNTNMITKALAVVYCVSIMDKMPLHILGTTSFVATGIAMAAASTASLSYAMHAAVSKPNRRRVVSALCCGRSCPRLSAAARCGESLTRLRCQMFIVGYFGQDLAHFATGEQT
jgi:hypothetical protein